jgi:hypothetical protein
VAEAPEGRALVGSGPSPSSRRGAFASIHYGRYSRMAEREALRDQPAAATPPESPIGPPSALNLDMAYRA